MSRAAHHHSVYVILLDDAVANHPSVLHVNPKRDASKPCVYVGMTFSSSGTTAGFGGAATGRGIAKDEAKAVEWYEKSAAQGYAPAEANLGGMYSEGLGIARDEAKAVGWFQMAAAQGHAVAQFNLAIRYAGGIGISKDEAKAAEWLQKSAFQGYPAAQFNLGVMYANGIGGPKDPVRAHVWYTLAARQKDPEAMQELAVLNDRITPVQKAEAGKILAELIGKIPGR